MHPKSFQSACMMAVFCFLLAFAASTNGTPRAQAQSPVSSVPLVGHLPQKVSNGTAFRLGHYNPDQKLRLVIAIKPPHMAEEEELIREQQTKGSPNFHKFLTAEEWNARFAPSAEDEQAVVDWAVSQGLTVTHRFDHRLLVDLEGTSGLIEKAFGVTINSYQVDDEVDFSNDREPSIPANLSGRVSSIQGLNNIERDRGARPGADVKGPDYSPGPAFAVTGHDQADARSPQPSPEATSNDSSNSTLFTNGYANPTEIFSSQVYNYNGLQNLGHCCNPHNDSGGTPNVSNIAIAAFGTFLGSDITGFQAAYPYLAYNYDVHEIDGTIDCTTNPSLCPDGETTQDTEWTIATANSFGASSDTSKIYIYEGANENNGTFTDMYGFMLSDNLARVFTTSWSCTEVYGCSTSTMDARHAIFNNMLGQGWTLIAASGDRGSSDDCYLNKSTDTYNTAHESVAYPGSDYDVLAAGGTFLMVYSDGSWDYEHAWQGGTTFGSCGSNNGGSGGGVSSYYTKPGFQGYSTWSGASHRSTPDISLNAVGIGQNLFINGNLQCCANGTSIVAPELAGFFAQENAYLNYIGNICGSGGTSACTPVGSPMQYFYPAAFYNDASHFPFYDMTGDYCNSNDVTAAQDLGYYCTGVGWDNVTGWGSANMLQLAWAINWYLIPASGIPNISWSGPATGDWYNSDQAVGWTINDYGGGTFPGTGIAGFTQGWDSIPPDSSSKPHGGTGDTYWSGPQYTNVSNGCLSFDGADGCASLASPQGCHTAHVRGWNNQGWTTGDATYGPICYDSVAPTISISANPSGATSNYVDKSVVITLTSSDPGGSNASGIAATYYGIDTVNCYPANLGGCSVYTGPFTYSGQGANYIYYFTMDKAGNASTETYIWVYIDTAQPVATASLSGSISSGSIYKTAVQVSLSATTTGASGVAKINYELDGGAQTIYSSPITVSALGSHSIKYWGVSGSGEVGNTTTTTFSIASPTTATVVATPNPSKLGGSVTMTATIIATLSGTPSGTVTFWNGATNLGTGNLSGGVATLTTTALPAGLLTLQVSYPGAGNFLATNSPPFDQTVNEKTTTTLTSSLNPSAYGQTVTFTAVVAPSSSGTPTGYVSFYTGTDLLGTADLFSGVASLSLPAFVPGTYSVTAVYSGDSTYLTSTSSTLSQKVKQASQTITFPSIGQQPALTSVTPSATSSSGLPVTYSTKTSTICSISGSTVSLLIPGTCTVTASQAGNSDYAAAANASRNIVVMPAPQTITFPMPASQDALSTLTLSATASSGLTVSFTSLTPTYCTVSGESAAMIQKGTCTIQASQPGNSIYAGAPKVSRSFVVNHAPQTISFATIASHPALSTVTLSASATSGLAVSFTSLTPSVCTVSGNSASLLEHGNCTIQASQAGNNVYGAAPDVDQGFGVSYLSQTITFASIPQQTVNTTITLSAEAGSGLPVTFTTSTPTICTVTGSSLTLNATGICTVDAHQAGNNIYSAAPTVGRNIQVVAN